MDRQQGKKKRMSKSEKELFENLWVEFKSLAKENADFYTEFIEPFLPRQEKSTSYFLNGIQKGIYDELKNDDIRELLGEVMSADPPEDYIQALEVSLEEEASKYDLVNMSLLISLYVWSRYGDDLIRKKEDVFRKLIASSRIRLLMEMQHHIFYLRRHLKEENNQTNVVAESYFLGWAQGNLSALNLATNQTLRDTLASQKGNSHQSKRWASHNEKRQKAIEVARDKWEKGDEALHYEMAEHILAKLPDLGLSYQAVLRALKPLARQYDRLWGEKGVRKEN